MEIGSINVAPVWSSGATMFIFQNGRDMEEYVEEFLSVCHRATASVQPHLPSITTPEPDPAATPTVEMEPEPTADKETQPMPTTEPELAASFVWEGKPKVPADQVCELDITSDPLGVLVELEEDEWLIALR